MFCCGCYRFFPLWQLPYAILSPFFPFVATRARTRIYLFQLSLVFLLCQSHHHFVQAGAHCSLNFSWWGDFRQAVQCGRPHLPLTSSVLFFSCRPPVSRKWYALCAHSSEYYYRHFQEESQGWQWTNQGIAISWAGIAVEEEHFSWLDSCSSYTQLCASKDPRTCPILFFLILTQGLCWLTLGKDASSRLVYYSEFCFQTHSSGLQPQC